MPCRHCSCGPVSWCLATFSVRASSPHSPPNRKGHRQMPVNQIVNTLNQSGDGYATGSFQMQMEYDSAQTGNLVNGNIVAIETGTTTPWLIKKTLHGTVDNLMWGVVVDAPTGGYIPGSS